MTTSLVVFSRLVFLGGAVGEEEVKERLDIFCLCLWGRPHRPSFESAAAQQGIHVLDY